MHRMKTGEKFTFIFYGVLLAIFSLSCKKDWLDEKPFLSLRVPSTIADFQSMLDNSSDPVYAEFNVSQNGLGEMGSDNFYLMPSHWQNNGDAPEQNTYTWASDLWAGTPNSGEWNIPYERVFYSNVILEGINKVIPKDNNEQVGWNQVKGSALFFRAYSHYDVAQQFCKPYIESTASSDLGIPIRLNSDFNEPSVRGTVKQTYDQIVDDLKTAAVLLPVPAPSTTGDTALYKIRPTKAAANAMLARVYLAMANYDSALAYADKCLQQYNVLINYASRATLARNNLEVIFQMRLNQYGYFLNTRLIVDSTLLNSYHVNDLRKERFFVLTSGTWRCRAFYEVVNAFFGGLATDEVYLIRAECYARKQNKDAAMADLNALMSKRWRFGVPYPTFTATDANDALKKILTERRKELCFRGLRWADLRRLNREPEFAVTLTRQMNGTHVLPPNSPLYVLPFPLGVIALTDMQQNPR